MENFQIKFEFPDATPGKRSNLATELEHILQETAKESSQNIKTKIIKSNDETQDFGATLVLVLGTPFLILLGQAIRDWSIRENQSSIDMNGVRITGLRSEDVAAIVERVPRNAVQE